MSGRSTRGGSDSLTVSVKTIALSFSSQPIYSRVLAAALGVQLVLLSVSLLPPSLSCGLYSNPKKKPGKKPVSPMGGLLKPDRGVP